LYYGTKPQNRHSGASDVCRWPKIGVYSFYFFVAMGYELLLMK